MVLFPLQTNASASKNVSTDKSARIPSHDFRAWDEYDADQAAERVDNEAKKSSSSVSTSPKGIPIELSEAGTYLYVSLFPAAITPYRSPLLPIPTTNAPPLSPLSAIPTTTALPLSPHSHSNHQCTAFITSLH